MSRDTVLTKRGKCPQEAGIRLRCDRDNRSAAQETNNQDGERKSCLLPTFCPHVPPVLRPVRGSIKVCGRMDCSCVCAGSCLPLSPLLCDAKVSSQSALLALDTPARIREALRARAIHRSTSTFCCGEGGFQAFIIINCPWP
uniref:Uncharacterized protein n=1 Tax=Knipowitschia caucasica TaxID=637954 RepID=A0AAV2LIF0_KNICA